MTRYVEMALPYGVPLADVAMVLGKSAIIGPERSGKA
jgi:hypothetical protein